MAVGGTAFADVHCHIKHSALDASHKFALGVGRSLEVETSHDSMRGHTFVVLHEVYLSHFFFEFALREAFEELSSGIMKHLRFDDNQPVDGCLDYFHVLLFLVFLFRI